MNFQPKVMFPLSVDINSYTSCIKIAGIPILPPLIDDDKRRDLMELKKKAVLVENRVRERQKIREQSTLSRKDSGIFTDTTCSPKDTIPGSVSDQRSDSGNAISKNLTLSAEKENFVPPKLVRQKSYTLDSPSPQLVAYMEKQREKERKPGSLKRTHTWAVSDVDRKPSSTDFKPFSTSSIGRRSRKNWNLEEARTRWKAEKKIKIVINKTPKPRKLEKTMSLSHSCPTSPLEIKNENCFTPVTSTSDRSFGTNRLNVLKPNVLRTSTPGRFDKISSSLCEGYLQPTKPPTTTPSSSVKTLHNSDSITTIDSVCCSRLESNTMPITPERDSDCRRDFEVISTLECFDQSVFDDSLSVCSSVSLNKYMQNDAVKKAHNLYSDLKQVHQQQFEELLRRHEIEKQVLFSRLSNIFMNADQSTNSFSSNQESANQMSLTLPPSRLSETSFELTDRTEAPVRSISRQLFPSLKCAVDYNDKEKNAATVITAYAKGFLVRRLFRTRRVEQIVLSIKDSISCALKLHAEENLTQADIELHRRLIVQMTADQFALVNIFNLPLIKKMAIIKSDREIRKTSRPNSGQISSASRKVYARKQTPVSDGTMQNKDKLSSKKGSNKKTVPSVTSLSERSSRSSTRTSLQPWR
ncbi:uncharacterized protein LOC111049968 isoform X1 [Nilaparvata lugens]|uniref:uncharacterized protein LOC111049968 isoform X1 n=1 Tax=Nilaparvata lugens TaxID=108931 RepID=UPI00193EB054|nr:uncharacterized protein LOC111049968 isoform X1 [Nilaparvata lugens]